MTTLNRSKQNIDRLLRNLFVLFLFHINLPFSNQMSPKKTNFTYSIRLVSFNPYQEQ